MKRLFFAAIFALFTVPAGADAPLFSFHTDNARITSIIKPLSDDFLDAYCVPIDFSSVAGFNCFLQRFNNETYPLRVLPHRLSQDLGQFLDEARASNQGLDFVVSVFRLFNRRIKMAPGLDAPEVLEVIKMLPDIMGPYLVTERAIQSHQQTVKDIMYDALSNNFVDLQDDPDKFLNTLSSHICNKIFKQAGTSPDDVVTAEDLHFAILNFLEVCMNKLVWSPVEDKAIFDSFKAITGGLIQLKEMGIIRHRAYLKDLVDSAVMRFCQFLSMTGAELSLDFYKYAHEQMKQELPIDLFEEDLPMLSTLREILHATLMKNVVKSTARSKYGLITGPQKP